MESNVLVVAVLGFGVVDKTPTVVGVEAEAIVVFTADAGVVIFGGAEIAVVEAEVVVEGAVDVDWTVVVAERGAFAVVLLGVVAVETPVLAADEVVCGVAVVVEALVLVIFRGGTVLIIMGKVVVVLGVVVLDGLVNEAPVVAGVLGTRAEVSCGAAVVGNVLDPCPNAVLKNPRITTK